ncbi:MAG TPA: hypothetical protein VHV27_02860 [Phenylobacterium sp.]|nr:hypothetical protein [Phenylobacterium sp.]
MPRPVLQVVAALLVLAAAGSFAMGVINAPERGRMPGERTGATAAAAGGAAIDAPEATPLSQDRIEAAPKPVEKASNTADSDDEDNSDDTATNATAPVKSANAIPAAAGATNTTAPAPPDLTNAIAPPQEEPPH